MNDILEKIWEKKPLSETEDKKFNQWFYTTFFSCSHAVLSRINEIQKYMFILPKEQYYQLLMRNAGQRRFVKYYLKKKK